MLAKYATITTDIKNKTFGSWKWISNYLSRFIDIPTLIKWGSMTKTATVLQIGCGNEMTTLHLIKKIKCKKHVVLDSSKELIANLKQSKKIDAEKIEWVHGHVLRLPLEDELFDHVFVNQTLYREANWKKALGEIQRVLKKNGRLLLADFSYETFSKPLLGDLLRQVVSFDTLSIFDRHELANYLDKNGFIVTNQKKSHWQICLMAVKRNPAKSSTSSDTK